MPEPCARALLEHLDGARCYLEYGSGGTTIAALARGVPVISVESDKDWHSAVSARAQGFDTPAFLLHADIGPTENWGHPADASGWARYHTYPLGAWETARDNRLVPELVLIDGRFRRACFFASMLFAAPGTAILFDDYADRAYGETIETFFKPHALIERMGLFTVPQTLERDGVWLALIHALSDPE